LFRRGLLVEARFGNVQDLKVGDPVKMAGKQIGRVREIRFDNDRVLVEMKIADPSAHIRTDSQATIKFSGLLGQNFVSVDFGAKGELITTDGQAIRSTDPQDLSQLLSKIDGVAGDLKKITGNFSDVHFDDIILVVNDFIKDARRQVLPILTNVNAVSTLIASDQGTIGHLVNQDALYNSALSTVTNLNSTAEDVREVVKQAKEIVAYVGAGQGTIGALIRDKTLHTEVTAAATSLREILEKVNRGDGSVGKLVNDDALINNAKLTLQKLDKATETLEDQGPLTILGILVNPLF